MDHADFRRHAHELVDWMADYLENVRDYPVKSPVAPGEILRQLPDSPPDNPEPFDKIMADFQHIIMPGITHWQHPRFMGYFPANSSPASVLAEMLTATLGVQGMIWATSPAAAELEEQVMAWLGRMIGIPDTWDGVIQDTASTATLTSILTAREQASNYAVNNTGLQNKSPYAVYCSTETHSSIEKAIKIAGLGREYLRKIPVDSAFALRPDLLEDAIRRDEADGVRPLCVVATIGTTGSTAIDPLRAIGEICRRHNVWLHVDAAFAGTALLLPEMRWMIDGIELADTFVFNPHKWMFTNFDCSAYFVKDKGALIRTFEILPEYLKTKETAIVNNYRDWGIPLGRRFRALKLWFVIRTYGLTGLQEKIRTHLTLARTIVDRINASDDFEFLAPTPLTVLCFRYHPKRMDDSASANDLNENQPSDSPNNLNGKQRLDSLNSLNEKLLDEVNRTGKLFITHTKLNGAYTLRLVISQTDVTESDLNLAWDTITTTARDLF